MFRNEGQIEERSSKKKVNICKTQIRFYIT